MTFKNGYFTGIIIGLAIFLAGYLFTKKLDADAQQMYALDVHQLHYYDLDGKEVQLNDFKGKNVLLNFWATWCKPCVAEFPLLNEVYSTVNEDFTFIVVSDESNEKIKKFAAKNDYNFTYLKTDKLLLNGITSLPQTFILNKELEKKKYHPTVFKEEAASIVDSLSIWVQ